jgi:hypothetical protein
MHVAPASLHLHAFDISRVIELLNEHPPIRFHRNGEASYNAQTLIDDFICYSINNFQVVWIANYDARRNTQLELTWFNLNQEARHALWSIINLPPEAAGTFVQYYRRGDTLWLGIPIY